MTDLKKLLLNAWKTVKVDYTNGLINSERCLQASLYRALRIEIDNIPELKVFVEPDWKGSYGIPDVVVCESGTEGHEPIVAALLELKFVPHFYPEYKNDMKKLRDAVHTELQQLISLVPSSGEFDNIKYTVSDKTLPVFVVVGKEDAAAVDQPANNFSGLKEKLFVLSAKTGGDVKFYADGKELN